MEKLGLFSWDVKESSIQTVDGIAIPSKKAIMRDDNNSILSVVHHSYQPFTNREFEDIINIVGDNVNSDSVNLKEIEGGKRLIAQVKLPKGFKIGGDKVEQYFNIINGHDGKTGIKFGFGNTVLSCKNQFHTFLRGDAMRNHRVSIRHNGKMMDYIVEWLDYIDKLRDESRKLEEVYNLLDEEFLYNTEMMAKSFSQKLLGVDVSVSKEDWIDNGWGESPIAYDNAKLLYDSILRETSAKGESLWGVFNGVTWYTNHEMTARDRDKSLMFGKGRKLNEQALQYASELVGFR
jgi:hypothetical protein